MPLLPLVQRLILVAVGRTTPARDRSALPRPPLLSVFGRLVRGDRSAVADGQSSSRNRITAIVVVRSRRRSSSVQNPDPILVPGPGAPVTQIEMATQGAIALYRKEGGAE
ncbi:uncharacterized protein FOMMEDRAFT_167639 [Fomitiporia mediterranea MF3/22]|uniref:uncharacterized protein n=1 Tax=Fomitiporia mediterranea (strain MF3/22) TaxID=694068 RepID=UPI00044085E5|nr:uncharacterized protein FOMMEDRAFT_167639 [Fomitiporia mediterranea MF3/22]EJD04454.1 hypothetical protein FOMMEDRAFT_167639 [Fomitiporia mediterranea MF3/22]